MRRNRILDARVALVSFACGVSLIAALLILVRGPESLLIIAIIPVGIAAALYPRWVYLSMFVLLAAAAAWTVAYLSKDVGESCKTLAALAVTTIGVAEIYRWLTQRRRAANQELRWQASLLTESPNPILRISADLRVLFSNPAAAELIRAHEGPSGRQLPGAWQALVAETLRTGRPTDAEWEAGSRVFLCRFVPVAAEGYVNTFLLDITDRHAAEATLRRQHEYLAALHETTLGLINHLDPVVLLDVIVNRATQLLDASFGWLYLLDQQDECLELKMVTKLDRSLIGVRLHPGEGLAGRVWRTGQPEVVEDYPSWSDRSPQFPIDLLRSAIGVPLKSGAQVIGVLGASQSDTARSFGSDEVEVLNRFAQLASISLENARLYAELRRQARELALLHEVRTALAGGADLSVVLRTVVDASAHTFGYTQVSMYLLQDGVLRLQHQVGYHAVIPVIPLSTGIMGRTARTGQAILVEDVRTDPDFLEAIPGVVSEVCVPLMDQGQVMGVLNVESTAGAQLTEADLHLLVALGEYVNLAIQRVRLYTEASQNEQRHRSVIENVREVIFQADAAGVWTYLSPAWTQITGFDVADTIGKPMVDFVHPNDRAGRMSDLQALVSDGCRSCQCEVRYLTVSGEFRWLDTHAWPLQTPGGGVSGMSGVLNDITERKLAEEELQVQQKFALYVMNTMGQGLTIAGTDGRWEYVNPAFAQMLGYAPEELVGKTMAEYLPVEERSRLERVRAGRLPGLASSYETRLQRADGSSLYALVTGTPHRRGNQFSGSISVVTDLTERQQIEQALALARDQAVEASRLKSEFLATMSHEVRTPMNSILGMNELLLGTTLSDEQREYAEAVQLSAEGLLSVIDDILDFSKIEANKLALIEGDFQVRSATEEVCEMFAATARAKGLALTAAVAPEAPAWLYGDVGRLKQVLVNLISNAVKFTDRGQVNIVVRVVDTTADRCTLRFEVVDTGIGISRIAHQRLFEPFTQVDGSMARKHSGAGLGLAISKRLVELMGGEIGVDSEAGAGAAFWFTVQCRLVLSAPAAAGAEAAGGAGPRSPALDRAAGVRILLAEDNPVNQRLAVLQLERLGYVVHAVADGRMAVDSILQAPHAYDLVLMDCQMPVIDGFEATRAIRLSDSPARCIPVIAMTANAMQGDREACLAAGMDDYVSKPVRPAQLDQVLRRWLSQPSGDSPGPRPAPAAARAGRADDVLDADLVTDLLDMTASGGPNAFDDLIAAFLAAMTERITALRSDIERQDAAALASTAHSLKGSSGSYGARRLSALARQLELIGRQGHVDGAAGLLQQAEDELIQVRRAFAAVPRPGAA